MKYRDKLIKYFEEAPEGAVIVANDMYEKGFTKMSMMRFFVQSRGCAMMALS